MSAIPDDVDGAPAEDDGWPGGWRARRAERGPLPSLEDAIELFRAELPEVVAAHEEGEADDAAPAVGRRVDVAAERSGRRVTFTASYESLVADKRAVLRMRFPVSRLRRHARDQFLDASGFGFDEIFEIEEVLLHLVDWWSGGHEQFRWPDRGRR